MLILKITLTILVSLIFGFSIYGGEPKKVFAGRLNEPVKIDGIADESVWNNSNPAVGFVVYDPVNGAPASQKTEVKVVYDDNAVYFLALLHDTEPEKILKEYSRRDVTNINADNFRVSINPYSDGQNIFNFQVSSVNVQVDFKETSTITDYTWNAVWESAVQITESGWVVEMKIPYSAIRFPVGKEQKWDINFWRLVRRIRENSSWNFVDKEVGNTGMQMGTLEGISDIKSPLRLSFIPYLSAYVQHNSENSSVGYSFIGGMDIKYGINESFTLDATLIPDFGQTKSDDKVLNLSPYEVKYSENRQFFMEGTELFNKAGLFYSRRIGSMPSGYYNIDSVKNLGHTIEENPNEAKLLNATKISGRNKNNLGIGFFNAVTGNTYARVRSVDGGKYHLLTEPYINYNIFVADQSFGRNSYVNIINTNMYQPTVGRMANVTGTAFRVFDEESIFAFHGSAALSNKTASDTSNNIFGEFYNLNLGKLNGNLIFNYGFTVMSDKYDPNDMGYLARNNQLSHNAYVTYRIFKPFWQFLYLSSSLSINYEELYKPGKYSEAKSALEINATFKNYISIGITCASELRGSHDYFEPRVPGRFIAKPRYNSFSSWFSTDYRKSLAIDINTDIWVSTAENAGASLTIAPRIRLNDHFLFTYASSLFVDKSDKGFVRISGSDIVFGRRNNNNITNTFSGTYVFNNKSYLSASIRHYWSEVDYNRYYILENDGSLRYTGDVAETHDLSFNAFTVDLSYSWNFAPGSFMNIMWKNNILRSKEILTNNFESFQENFSGMLKSPQQNSISLKLSYYIDYLYLKKNKTK